MPSVSIARKKRKDAPRRHRDISRGVDLDTYDDFSKTFAVSENSWSPQIATYNVYGEPIIELE